jgi:hypothetical protein
MSGVREQEPSRSPLPDFLVRFRSFGAPGRNGQDKTAVFELLRGGLSFSKLSDFNDPFEGKPYAVPAFSATN